ncbi:hypothetical protein FHS85_004422 [Rhodoligotrophos appendicifer]
MAGGRQLQIAPYSSRRSNTYAKPDQMLIPARRADRTPNFPGGPGEMI